MKPVLYILKTHSSRNKKPDRLCIFLSQKREWLVRCFQSRCRTHSYIEDIPSIVIHLTRNIDVRNDAIEATTSSLDLIEVGVAMSLPMHQNPVVFEVTGSYVTRDFSSQSLHLDRQRHQWHLHLFHHTSENKRLSLPSVAEFFSPIRNNLKCVLQYSGGTEPSPPMDTLPPKPATSISIPRFFRLIKLITVKMNKGRGSSRRVGTQNQMCSPRSPTVSMRYL